MVFPELMFSATQLRSPMLLLKSEQSLSSRLSKSKIMLLYALTCADVQLFGTAGCLFVEQAPKHKMATAAMTGRMAFLPDLRESIGSIFMGSVYCNLVASRSAA